MDNNSNMVINISKKRTRKKNNNNNNNNDPNKEVHFPYSEYQLLWP